MLLAKGSLAANHVLWLVFAAQWGTRRLETDYVQQVQQRCWLWQF